MRAKTHPHESAHHVMVQYRRIILGLKRKYGTARGLITYTALVQEYLNCKATYIREKANGTISEPV